MEGRCGGVEAGALEAGVQRSQRRKSMSWQDFVRREGAVVDSLRQLPLNVLVQMFVMEDRGRECTERRSGRNATIRQARRAQY